MTVDKDIFDRFQSIRQVFEKEPTRRLVSDGSGRLIIEYNLQEETNMNFGEAINAIKSGKRAAREGWNGKNQYIELATNISYINADKECINVNHDAIGNSAIAFVGTSGVQLGWLASQADMLAEDWVIK